VAKNKLLRCQHPIAKDVEPQCKNIATSYDQFGWTYCDKHTQKGYDKIRYVGHSEQDLQGVYQEDA
jgi:hypothetical protein